MIDFLKFRTEQVPQLLKSKLEFYQKVKPKTGEVMKGYTADYHNFEIEIKSDNYATIKGSIHKLHNIIKGSGNHNHNQFSFSDCSGIIDHLCQTLRIDADKCRLHTLEYGFNISPTVPTQTLLSYFIAHKNKRFNTMNINRGYGLECYHTNYGIKAYDKAMQYRQAIEIFRYEKKVTRILNVHHTHLYLSNLQDFKFWQILKNDCIDSLNDLVTVELFPNELTAKESQIIDKLSNPLFWENSTRNQRQYGKAKLNEIKQKYRIIPTKEIVLNSLSKKTN